MSEKKRWQQTSKQKLADNQKSTKQGQKSQFGNTANLYAKTD